MHISTENEKTSDPGVRPEEQALASVTTRLATTLQSAGDGVVVTDLEGRVEFLNPAAERLTGIQSASAEGRPLLEILRLEQRFRGAVRDNLVELAIISGGAITLGKDLLLLTQTGQTREIEGEISVRTVDGFSTGTVITLRDVTVRNWDERQRREEQKFSAVGRLAGAVAHELNNFLTIIVGHSEMLDERCPNLAPVRASTAAIQQAAAGIATVTRQLVTLSRREILQPKALNLNAFVEKATTRLWELLPAGIKLVMSFEPQIGTILVDPAQLEQALFNLVRYCRGRAPTESEIELGTANVIVDGNSRGCHLRRYVQLTIRDSGPGFNGHATEELFEPSVSTDPSRHYDIEMLTVRNVVSAASGHLSIESESEVGAKFVLLFPQIDEEIELTEDRSATTNQKNKSTLLLVEDDDAIRILLRNSFEKHGYRVLEARDGKEALFQSELYEEGIDLLISDVVMPHMDGPALARNLIEVRPDIEVLLMSGCPVESADVQNLVEQGVHFVQKPFSQRELLARIEAVLKN
jgi:two-component system cell cycle sensor histidine kinase/response regulator CckA